MSLTLFLEERQVSLVYLAENVIYLRRHLHQILQGRQTRIYVHSKSEAQKLSLTNRRQCFLGQ